jgi:GR25 family glycosyltransferase involved in LPS biosynthesis
MNLLNKNKIKRHKNRTVGSLTMELFKNTLFINLEHRTDRLEHIQLEFQKMGIRGERVNAVKSKIGGIGCTLSHIRCLEEAKKRNYEYVFICEDDITFNNPELFKKQLQQFWDNKEIQWDVLVIGGNVVPPYQRVGDYCARVFNCQTTTGYVVKREMYNVFLENFKESAQMQMRKPGQPGVSNPYALDIYWKRLQPQYFWWIICPMTVTQYENFSEIENQVTNYDHLMLDMEKEWFMKQKTSVPSPLKMNFNI